MTDYCNKNKKYENEDWTRKIINKNELVFGWIDYFVYFSCCKLLSLFIYFIKYLDSILLFYFVYFLF